MQVTDFQVQMPWSRGMHKYEIFTGVAMQIYAV